MVEALRRLDPLLDLLWDPKAKMVHSGGYSVLGKRRDPEYQGRWKVIRRETPGLHDERGYVVIVTVTRPFRFGAKQILMMESNGPYAPVGEWLVEYMQTYDAAQRRFSEVMGEVAKEHERAENLAEEISGKQGAHQEALEKVYHKSAGSYWMGGAAGKAHPVTQATLFGKGKKTDATAGATSP